MTQADENKALVRRMEDEIFNKRRLAAVDEFIAPDYVLRTAAEGAPSGRDAVRDSIAAYLAGFPDLRISVDELVAEDDRVVGCFTFTGTHDGDLFGMPPTGLRISVRQIAIYRIRDGRVVEEWEVSDQLGLMQQVGAIPSEA
ncbi:MAG: ester cyclase [Dehalococcoidia bacterium]